MHYRVPVGHFPCDKFAPLVPAFSALITSVHLGSVEGIVYWEPWKEVQVVANGRANNDSLCVPL